MITAIIFDLYEGKIRFINGNFIIVKSIFHKSKALETQKV